MFPGHVRWVLRHVVRTVCGAPPGCWSPASRFLERSERSRIIPGSVRQFPFCTDGNETEQTQASKTKRQDPRAHATINNVGRKIPHRLIQVISEAGDNLGAMHRADVIKIMDEQGLKLILLSEHKDPPVYRLMSGKQIHEEQLKLREKLKAKAAPVQVKEITFSNGIASHDVTTKMRRVESWLEKKHHVRITLRSGRAGPAGDLDTSLEQIVQQMEVTVGFVSKPKVIRGGQAAMCVLRPPSAKELSQKKKNKPDSSTRTADGDVQH